jgi:hypothetical protein
MLLSSIRPATQAGAADSNFVEFSAAAAVAAIGKGDIKAEDYARALLYRAQQLASLNDELSFGWTSNKVHNPYDLSRIPVAAAAAQVLRSRAWRRLRFAKIRSVRSTFRRHIGG